MDFWEWVGHPDRWSDFPVAFVSAAVAGGTALLVVWRTNAGARKNAQQDRWEAALADTLAVLQAWIFAPEGHRSPDKQMRQDLLAALFRLHVVAKSPELRAVLLDCEKHAHAARLTSEASMRRIEMWIERHPSEHNLAVRRRIQELTAEADAALLEFASVLASPEATRVENASFLQDALGPVVNKLEAVQSSLSAVASRPERP